MIIIEIADTGIRFSKEHDAGIRWFVVDTNSEKVAIRKVAKIVAEEENTTIKHAFDELQHGDGFGMMDIHQVEEVLK